MPPRRRSPAPIRSAYFFGHQAAAAVFSFARPASVIAISSSSSLIEDVKSNGPRIVLSSVAKRQRWAFRSSSAFRFPSLTYAATIRSIASDMSSRPITELGQGQEQEPPGDDPGDGFLRVTPCAAANRPRGLTMNNAHETAITARKRFAQIEFFRSCQRIS